MNINLTFTFLLLCILMSCSNPYFEKEKQLETGVWTYENPFSFSFQAEDTTKQYDFLLTIEHGTSYPFQNIYFQVQTVFPHGDTIKDPFSINLADKFGHWNGKCWGDRCSLTVPIQSKVKFKNKGEHHLTFEQFTRQDSLNGINSLEFSIVRSSLK